MAVTAAAIVAVASSSPAGAASHKVQTNTTFAGFEVIKTKAHIHSASVRFVIPTITCRNNLSGVGPSVLIQSTGNVRTNAHTESGGGVGVACEHKTPIYNAIVEVASHSYDDSRHPLAAGDKVVVTVRYGKTKTVATVHDLTTKHAFSRSARRTVGEIAFFGDSSVEVNQQGIGLDPFTTTHFSAAKINGRWIRRQKPIRINWVNARNAVLVAASRLSAHDRFTTTFKRSS